MFGNTNGQILGIGYVAKFAEDVRRDLDVTAEVAEVHEEASGGTGSRMRSEASAIGRALARVAWLMRGTSAAADRG